VGWTINRLPAFLKGRIIMRTTFTVHHHEHVSSWPFEEVSIGEENVYMVFLLLYGGVQAIKIGQT
jgi:hypothetical protein